MAAGNSGGAPGGMSFTSKNPAVRRIFREVAELRAQIDENPNTAFCAIDIVNDNIFDLHFTIRGPPDSAYAGGCYHGKLILPHDYPFKPPEITFLTPNGRFETKKKICLSISDYHPESWQPAWGLRTVLIGISSFMAVESAGSIGSVTWTHEERVRLAEESLSWVCPDCARANSEILPPQTAEASSDQSNVKDSLPQELQFSYSNDQQKQPQQQEPKSTSSSSNEDDNGSKINDKREKQEENEKTAVAQKTEHAGPSIPPRSFAAPARAELNMDAETERAPDVLLARAPVEANGDGNVFLSRDQDQDLSFVTQANETWDQEDEETRRQREAVARSLRIARLRVDACILVLVIALLAKIL